MIAHVFIYDVWLYFMTRYLGSGGLFLLPPLSCPQLCIGILALMPDLWGVPIKYISLFVLVIQNSAYILVLRASRIQVCSGADTTHSQPGEMYIPTTAVVASEVLKTIGSVFLVFLQEGGVQAGIKVSRIILVPTTAHAARNLQQAADNNEASCSCGSVHIPGSVGVA